MSLGDIIVIIFTASLILLIVFFKYIRPKILHQNVCCCSCPIKNKGKYLVKDYKSKK